MIISASRRTDIPCFYSQWFYNRMKAGYACVANPFSAHQISRISLSPDVVDAIVFWTKNPEPMLGRLKELEGHTYYFQFTLTGYGKPVEPGLSDVERLVDTFWKLSNTIGADRVLWRYDPILVNENYTLSYHADRFGWLAEKLKGATKRCTISFLDEYPGIKKNLDLFHLSSISDALQRQIARNLSKAAEGTGIAIYTCAEKADLSEFGIEHGSCIDRELLERLLGCRLVSERDKNQRPACGCAASIDIGTYDTCRNGCLYCYACHGKRPALMYDPDSEILCRKLGEADHISVRCVKSLTK